MSPISDIMERIREKMLGSLSTQLW